MHSVSIVMVVKNERKNLERIFPIVQSQEFDAPVEIICVDSGSSDGTVAFLDDHGVTLIAIAPAEFHHGKTRNLGASHARNDLLVFLSGDALPTSNQWLKSLVAHFDDPAVGGVYGRQVPPTELGRLRAHALEHEYPATRIIRNPAQIRRVHPGLFRFSNVNSAVRRDIWARFKFNETLLLAEDQGMCRDIFMAGLKIVYEPAAAVVHGHGRNLRGELQFAFENGFSLTQMQILRNPAIGGETGYGLRRLRDDVAHFLSSGRLDLAAAILAVDAVKWLGVQLGKREEKLPLRLTQWISPGVARLARARDSRPAAIVPRT